MLFRSTLSLYKSDGSQYALNDVIRFSSSNFTSWNGYDANNLTSFNNFQSKINFGEGSGLQAQISFSGGITSLTVAAIPEPRVYAAAACLIVLVGVTEYRRRRRPRIVDRS